MQTRRFTKIRQAPQGVLSDFFWQEIEANVQIFAAGCAAQKMAGNAFYWLDPMGFIAKNEKFCAKSTNGNPFFGMCLQKINNDSLEILQKNRYDTIYKIQADATAFEGGGIA